MSDLIPTKDINTVEKSKFNSSDNVFVEQNGSFRRVPASEIIDASGYYTPIVTQPTANSMQVSFVPSTENMPTVDPATITLPGSGQNGKDYSFDPTVYGLPVLYLTGDTTGMSKDVKKTMNYSCQDAAGNAHSGTCTQKWQGSSSIAYEKKNYTIAFDTAFEAFSGWGAQKKYCFKANFIDATHARNIVTAKLWGQMAKTRPNLPAEWAALPNAGAVDGFPCIIMLNGEFHGLYTWNIPKDGWMFGLAEDSAKTQAILCANKEADPVMFKAEAAVDGSDFEIEFISDEANTAWVKTSLNRLIKACMDTNGADLDATIAQYLDWDSAIDHYILTVLLGGSDILDKNFLLVTLDGTKWYFSAYDLDTTYGLKWNGSGLRAYDYALSFDLCAEYHKVYELIKRFKTNALKARYSKLRSEIWKASNVDATFENFAWAIPSPVMVEDVKKHPTILGSSVNTIDQICRWVHKRLEIVDEWAANLPAQETPAEPDDTPRGNLVPTSIDSDGNVFNGVGYQDDHRLNSSGAVVSDSGKTVTGYMPFVQNCTIRSKGAKNGTAAGGGQYIALYTEEFEVIGSNSMNGFPEASYTYVTQDGVDLFTLDCSAVTDATLKESFARAAYFRISHANCDGADLIVTVNEEIS